MHSLRHALSLGTTVALAAVLFALAPFTPKLEEDIGLTGLFELRGPRAVPPHVAVVAIDRAAAQALGQPNKLSEWPRSLHARLIDALSTAGVRVVAFDVSFATLARDPADDSTLAAALARAGNVVLLDALERIEAPGVEAVIERLLPPHPLLADAAAAHGPFVLPKSERVHAYWLVRTGAGGVATLPTLVSRLYEAGAPGPAAPRRLDARDESRYLDYYGPPRSVPTIGFHEVLAAAGRGAEGAAWLRQTFEGRAVFVGFSAADPSEQDRLRDDYRTVFARPDGLHLSGVEIAATAFANVLEDRAPQPLPLAGQFALLLGWGLLLGGICARLRAGQAVAATLAACAGYLAIAHAGFAHAARWLPLVTPLLVQAPLALLGGLLWHFVDERRERRRLGSVIEDLLPASVVEGLLGRIRSAASPEQPMMGVFIMTDIQGFTSMSEALPPADATRMLNDYFALVFPAVERHGGSVSQIDGDGMLAFWLDAEPDGSARAGACRAALEIAECTSRPGALPGWPPMPTRVGVHGGRVSMARVGASRHHEYRLVGDAANTAGRIEALSKHLGTRLLVSEGVLAGLDELLTRPLGRFVLAGKREPVGVHELMGHVSTAPARQLELCAAFAEALAAHGSRPWGEVVERWLALMEAYPDDGPSRFYWQLAKRQAAGPPPAEWDGVVRMATK